MHTSITAWRAVSKDLIPALWLVGIGICASGTAFAAPTAADARAFVARAEADLSADADFQNRAGWVQATYIIARHRCNGDQRLFRPTVRVARQTERGKRV